MVTSLIWFCFVGFVTSVCTTWWRLWWYWRSFHGLMLFCRICNIGLHDIYDGCGDTEGVSMVWCYFVGFVTLVCTIWWRLWWYWSSFHGLTLFCRICNIGLHDMMTAVVILKEFEKRGLITEVVKGVWIRSPSGAPGDTHGMLCSAFTFLSLIKFL